MTDRLFRLLPLAPLGTLAMALLDMPLHVRSSSSVADVLMRPGIREAVVLWLVPSLVVLFHLGWNRSLSGPDRRQWRRSLVVGGWAVAVIYLCSEDRRLPSNRAEDA